MFSKANCMRVCMSFIFIFFYFIGRGQAIRGIVLDAKTGEPMTGATVSVKGTGKSQFVKLDGNFAVRSLAPGDYEVEVSYANYKKHSEHVTVVQGKPVELRVILEPAILELSSVTVSGASGSDHTTRNIEKHSNQLVNVVSAKNMQLLPDITVANVLQRVSGVTIERNNAGEGRYPIIRGMEKRYINTLVNGVKIPSPDDKNRFVPLDLFPSELLERLEVSKSLTPSMEGDAIGGTINLVMKDAPASKLLQVNAAMGYNNIFNTQDYLKFKNTINKQSPAEMHGSSYNATPADFPMGPLNYQKRNTPLNETFGLTAGNRFGKDKQLGLLLSGSYQNIFSGTKSTFFLPNAQVNLGNMPQFQDLYFRRYSTENQRLGLTAKADYHINGRNKLSWTNTYVRLNMFQTRVSYDTVALNSLVNESYRTTWQYQSIYNSTLQGVHQLNPSLTVDWTAAYSMASNHIPDQSTFTHQYAVLYDTVSKSRVKGADSVFGMTRNWAHNSDKDWSGSLNITQRARLLERPLEIKLGGLIRDKKRDNFYNAYSLDPQIPAGGSRQPYTTVNNAQWAFAGGIGTPALNGNNYSFTEDVYAGYAQGKWQLSDRLELLGGLRVEHTQQQYSTLLSKEVDARSGKIWYTDLLPSGQVKYALSDLKSLRLSYYRAIARPQFAELIPDGPDNYETFKQQGNPAGLKHSIADNLDLRYEWFQGHADQLLLGVFYKRIQDPIEYTAYKVGVTTQYLIPQNIGTATNYGFEAVFTHYFGAFGISANYTYTHSRVKNDQMLYVYRDDAGSVNSKYVSETRPLQGQSDHVGNLSVLYKNPRIGLDIQVAFTYTGERITLVSPYAGLHYWQQPYAGLDASFEKRIIKRLTFYGKMNNLTNTSITGSLHVPYAVYLPSPGSNPLSMQTDVKHQIIVQKDYVRSSFLFGFRYKL